MYCSKVFAFCPVEILVGTYLTLYKAYVNFCLREMDTYLNKRNKQP